ncbi:MAG: hypothetical protein JWN99_1874, partial [Ilumatobacteraceae bacterium]|nr:hypothetical protein [Ilumatobacteraceae bacterium]
MQPRSRILIGLGLGAVLFTAGAFGIASEKGSADVPAAIAIAGPDAAAAFSHLPAGASLDDTITNLQARLKANPEDFGSWATLGLAYVQQAKVTVNSDYYPKADGALAKSIAIDKDQNFLAYAGLASLANARHDFAGAKRYAELGLAIDDKSAILYGALSDAETQLGQYPGAFEAVQHMLDRSPDTSSLSRASYTWELRGDIDQATGLMQRALDDAPTPSDRAFALFYLGELAFNNGDANAALTYYNQALDASPGDAAALEGKAKAEAAVGQILTALDDYAEVIQRTPEPAYVIEYGELLESVGRTEDAKQQYDLFATIQQLFEGNGVEPDSTPTLFYADHGDPVRALSDAEKGIATRPFVVMYDAYAWALHRNGRDAEALTQIDIALSTGMKNALFHFHKGMIELALGDV